MLDLAWVIYSSYSNYSVAFLAYLICNAGDTHFNDEGLAGWLKEQLALVQLSPKRHGCKTRNKGKQWCLDLMSVEHNE